MRRRVTLGASRASPAGYDSDRLEERLGGGVLQEEPTRACRQRLVDVLVQKVRTSDFSYDGVDGSSEGCRSRPDKATILAMCTDGFDESRQPSVWVSGD